MGEFDIAIRTRTLERGYEQVRSFIRDTCALCRVCGGWDMASMNRTDTGHRRIHGNSQVGRITRVIAASQHWRGQYGGGKMPLPTCDAKPHPSSYPIQFTTREGALTLEFLTSPHTQGKGTHLTRAYFTPCRAKDN